jgi:hypothetical protein
VASRRRTGAAGEHPLEHREMVADDPVGAEAVDGVGSAGASIDEREARDG